MIITEHPTPVDIAVSFIEAWARRDMRTVAGYVADAIAFESPTNQIRGAEPYLEVVGQFAQVVAGVRIIAALGDDERAMLMYDMTTGPFGTLRAAEDLIISNGRITRDTLVFDAAELRRAQG